MPGPIAPVVVLTDEERETLQRWAARPLSAQALALRCRIVLACAEGGTNIVVAGRLGISRGTVRKWRSGSLRIASTVCMTSPGLGRHDGSLMPTWRR